MKSLVQESPWSPPPILAASAAGSHPWVVLACLGDRQFGLAFEYAAIVARGFEALGKVSEEEAHRMALLHQHAANLARQGGPQSRQVALPWTLLFAEAGAMGRLWQAYGMETTQFWINAQECMGRHLAEQQKLAQSLLPEINTSL